MAKPIPATATCDLLLSGEAQEGSALLHHDSFAMQWEQVTALATRYPDAQQTRIRLLATALRHGTPMPTEAFLWLVDALDKIAEGQAAKKALGFTASTGATPQQRRLRQLNSIARQIYGFHHNGDLPLNDSVGGAGAISKAAAVMKTSEATAKLAWAVYGAAFKELGLSCYAQHPANLAPLQPRQGRKKPKPP